MKRKLPLAGIGAGVMLTASLAWTQCPQPGWFPANELPGFDAPPGLAIAWDPDGAGPLAERLVVSGPFIYAGGHLVNRIALWDGANWQPMGSGTDGPVSTLTVFNGDVIATGSFTVAGGVPAIGIARWSGSAWQNLGTGLSYSATAATVYNGELVVAAPFDLGGGPQMMVARWDGSSWWFLGGPFNAYVFDLTVFNGSLIATGGFTTVGATAANHVARWDGTSWNQIGTGLPDTMLTLAVHSGNLYAARQAATVSAAYPTGVARWDGSAWQPVGAGFYFESGQLIQYGGELIAYGSMAVGTAWWWGVFGWNGTSWHPIASTQAPPPPIAVVNGELLASHVGNGFARWTGSTWQPLKPGIDYQVRALKSVNGALVAGGRFTTASTPIVYGVARASGSTWELIGTGMNDEVFALETINGQLFAGGHFTAADGASVNGIAQWSGSSWQPLGTGMTSPPGPFPGTPVIRALGAFGGDLVAGGQFATAGGVPASWIARWDGTAWHALGTGVSDFVMALAVFNGELVVGGAFTSAGGAPANHVAKWNGSSWQPLGPGTSSIVNSLAVTSSGIVAGGYDGSVRQWNGTGWALLGSAMNASVEVLAVHQGELIAAGTFTLAGGTPAARIARWNGASWQPLGSGLDGTPQMYPPQVIALASHDGALFVGGRFGTAGGAVTPFLARWSPPLPHLQLSQPGGLTGQVRVTSEWLVAGHEYYDVVSLDLCPGAPGSGPYGGLCFSDPAFLQQQLLLPVGTAPFHFVAPGTTMTFGPYGLPPGLGFQAVSADVTGGTLACLSPVVAHTVY